MVVLDVIQLLQLYIFVYMYLSYHLIKYQSILPCSLHHMKPKNKYSKIDARSIENRWKGVRRNQSLAIEGIRKVT